MNPDQSHGEITELAERYKHSDIKQAASLNQMASQEAELASIKEFVVSVCTISTALLAISFFYPGWCRYRHKRFPYSAKQLDLRKNVLLIQFVPPIRPFKPRIGSKLIQACAIYGICKMAVEKFQG